MNNEQEVIELLKNAWKKGCSDIEACLYAHITEEQLKQILKYNPDLAGESALLKHDPLLRSRLNVVDAIKEGDVDTSWKYLTHKAKDEFSTKTTVDTNVTSNINEKLYELDNFLENFGIKEKEEE